MKVSSSLGFSILVYWVLGLYATAGSFFLFCLCMFLLLSMGETLGFILCGLFYDVGMATTVSSVFMSMFNIMAGFYRPDNTMPWIVRIVNYVLATKYIAEVIAVNEFEHLQFSCPGVQALPDGGCPLPSGEDVLDEYDFNTSDKWRDLGIAIALSFAYRIIAFLVLKFKRQALYT